MKMPLLVGGATTSKAHTAIKIDHHYSQPVSRVGDASLVVGVCNDLLSSERKAGFVEKQEAEYLKIRKRFEEGKDAESDLLDLAEVQSKAFSYDWENYDIPKPKKLGLTVLDNIDLEKVSKYIDWSPFFWTWELKGVFQKF